jgi:hypothetical protein
MKKNKLEEKVYNIFMHDIKITGEKYGKIRNLENSGLARNFDEYIFSIPYRLEKFIQKSSGWDVPDAAIPTLIEASQIFGFFTFGEILTSKLWFDEILPLLIIKKDWFEASIYLLNTFGYGVYEIQYYDDYIEDFVIIIQLKESLEADLYKRWYGTSELPKCYLSTGLLTSIINLIYKVDLENKPKINIDLYEKILGDTDNYKCIEKECSTKTKNDDKCIFEIKSNHH